MTPVSALRPCVCVPARNEAERLGRLLAALAAQDYPDVTPVVVALNNTIDASRSIVSACQRQHEGRLDIRLDEHDFEPELAHAGSARRRAMDLGAAWLGAGAGGVLVATDADARPPANWLTANLSAIAAGADIVGGALVLDDAEPVADTVAARRGLLDRYWRAVRAIEDEIDPRPWDPAPRHGDHTGASLAVTVEAYRAAGGVPQLALGEDVALVAAVVSCGGLLAHPENVWVRVSPRVDGRTPGGMAAAMVALAEESERPSVLMLPSFDQWRERAAWRRAIRMTPGGARKIAAQELALPPMRRDFDISRELMR